MDLLLNRNKFLTGLQKLISLMFIIFIVVMLFTTENLFADTNKFRSPWPTEVKKQKNISSHFASLQYGRLSLSTFLFSPFIFYNKVLTSIDGRDCPSYPPCSQYALQAFNRHGFMIGSLLVIDRLIHEGDEIKLNNIVLLPSGPKIYDPLSDNDFWIVNSGSATDKECRIGIEQDHEL